MTKRLMVTGAGGFVAGSVIREALGRWNVHALSRQDPLLEEKGLAWHTMDVRDSGRLREVFQQVHPDAVVHAAAQADIDAAERQREFAWRINVETTRALCDLCRTTRTRLVFLSTDTVFDGTAGNYTEDDAPGPVNYYAETKVEAERIVAAIDGNRVIARLALVMGFPRLGAGNSFLARMLPALEAGRAIHVPEEEIRSPIDVVTLGRALVELVGNDLNGIVHLAGNDVLNRLEMTRIIAEDLGYSPARVLPREGCETGGRAARPRDVSLNNRKARSMLATPMVGLREGLALTQAAREGTTP